MSIREDLSLGEVKLRSLQATAELTANVTQATSRSTGVTAHGVMGTITTTASSLAAVTNVSFTVTNNRVKAGSVVAVAVKSEASNRNTIAYVSAVADGSFDITLYNSNSSTADTTATVINYFVVNAVSGM